MSRGNKHGPLEDQNDAHNRVTLIIHHYTKPYTPKTLNYITRYLESFRIRYVITRTDDRLLVNLKFEMKKDVIDAKYSLIIFYEFRTYLTLSRLAREVIYKYCVKFNVGQMFFAGNNLGKISEFHLEIKRLAKTKPHKLRVNSTSKLLWMTKAGVEVVVPQRTRLTFLANDLSDMEYEPVAWFISKTSSGEEERKFTVLLDHGSKSGVRRIFSTLNFGLFLHELLFFDSLKFLSQLPVRYTLKRYIQVDIDDIFIGKSGLRLKKDDVKVF